ncbi:MAG: hypothetical protein QOJ89_5391 [bacterium]|jgi:hypothetical protein
MSEDAPQAPVNRRSRFEQTLAEVIWLESCGWKLATDGMWSHACKAGGAPLMHSQAFALEARRRPGHDEEVPS